ncbi:MAG: MBL fold metallo-hydrolase [Planctomycetota bacterium]
MNAWRLTPLILCFIAVGCGNNDEEIAAKLRQKSRVRKSETTSEADRVYATSWRGKENVTVQEGVHVIGSIYPSLSVVVETEQGVLLFDTCYEEDGRDYRDALLGLNVLSKRIKEVFITHAHFERLWGINRIRAVADVMVSAGKADCQAIRTLDSKKIHVLNADTEYKGGPIVVDRELEGGERFDFGDTTVEVIAAPGHTEGSVCYLVSKGGKRILIAGDVIGSLKFGPETFPVELSPRYGGDAASFLQTIEELMALDPPDVLLTGRPSLMTGAQPFAFDGDWREFLAPTRDQLKRIVQRQKRDGRDSLDETPKVLEEGLMYLGTLRSVAVYAIQTAHQLVVINAPGGETCSTFVADGLKQLGIDQAHPDAIWLTSADPETSSGLTSFDPMPLVVAPEAAKQELKLMGVIRPTLIGDAALENPLLGGAMKVEAIPLEDRQFSGVAYALRTAGKRVLLSPPIPRKVYLYRTDIRDGSEEREELYNPRRKLSGSIWEKPARNAYERALDTIADQTPDIWLPAFPVGTQSANLYDNDWQNIITNNRKLVKEMRQLREGKF